VDVARIEDRVGFNGGGNATDGRGTSHATQTEVSDTHNRLGFYLTVEEMQRMAGIHHAKQQKCQIPITGSLKRELI
jgi:hypothetical protein